MNILQLCNKPPYPPVDGGTMAMHCFTQGLLEAGHNVKVLAVSTNKHPVRREQMTEEYVRQTEFEAVYIDLRPHVVGAAVAMLSGESYNVKRYESENFEKKLREVLERGQYDIVQIEGLYLTPYVPTIRKHSEAKIVLRAHNVESEIWHRLAKSSPCSIKRMYLKHLALTLEAYEREHLNDYDGVVAITDNDTRRFGEMGCRRAMATIGFGIEPEEIDNIEVEANTLFHIGSMDWKPNEEGIRWFLDKVWPMVHKQMPQVRLYLAGRKMPEDLLRKQIEGVSVVGEVADAMYFIGSKQINIVPLKSGSGMRVKIIEAMAAGKAVVTTTVGAQGIKYKDGENLLIADTPEAFVEQIRRCVEEAGYAQQIGKRAYETIVREYNPKRLTEELTQFYLTLQDKQ